MDGINNRKTFMGGGINVIALFFLAFCLTGFLAEPAQAKYLGGNYPPPKDCPSCNKGSCSINNQASSLNALDILCETVPLFSLGSNSAASPSFSLTYKSDNADYSHALLDIGVGYGWAHSYSTLLFTQRGSMFRLEGDGNVTKYQRSAGNTYVATTGYFETLTQNPDGSFTLRQKDGTVYRFAKLPGDTLFIGGPVWRLLNITDRNGNSTTLTYGGTGQLNSITGADGRSLALTYNAGHLVSIKDPLNHAFQLKYDNTGRRLISITDPNNKSIQYSYNVLNQMTTMLDRDSHKTTFLYASGKPIGAVDGNGNSIFSNSNPIKWAIDEATLASTLMYEYVPSTTTQTDGRGNRWQYQYDRHGYVTKATAPDGAITLYTYDPATLKVACETDANGHQTCYEYDAQGNRIKETDALGHVTLYEYEPVFSNVTKITYPNGSSTEYQYDAQGNRTQEIRDVGGLNLQTNWTYYGPSEPGNASQIGGLIKTQEVRNGSILQVTKYEYDSAGDQIKVIDPENNATQYTYDADGNRLTMIDANGHVTAYEYDPLNRLIKETDPLGFMTLYAYDGNGNRTEVQKQVTKAPDTFQTSQYRYDLRDRLIKEIRDPGGLNLVTAYAYDNNDNRIQLTDPRSKITKYTYDVQNRLAKVQDALTHTAETRYDPVGNRICVIDANLHYAFFDYDALNRLTKESKKIDTQECKTGDADDIITQNFYDSGAPVPPIHCLALECEGPTPGSGNVAYMIDPEGKLTYFKYDHIDRRVMTIRKVGDTNDDFDQTGNPADDDWSDIVQYDAVGNILARTDANGNATHHTYLLNNWRKTEANALNETTSYTYDGIGNVKTVQSPGANLTTNHYNDRNELIQVSDAEGPMAGSDPVTKPGYVYDGVGNRIKACDGNDHCSQYAYDAVNRLIAVTDALGETSHHSYDPAGNLLKTLDREAHAMCYVYDDINRRTRSIQKVGDADCNVIDGDDVWTKTVYDAVGNVVELTTAKKIDGGTPPTCNSLSPPEDCETTRYVYDEVNRLAQEAYPLRQAGDIAKNTREFSYDKASNLKKRIDQKTQATDYVYNDLYYLTLRDYQTDPDDRFAYDTGGRMLRAGRAGWIVTFDYDAANRVLHTTQDGKPVDYLYDIPNRCRTLSYPSGKMVEECRDFRERLADINGGSLATYAYDPGNRVLTRSYGNGTAANYAYNDNNWITSLTHTKAGSILIAGFGHDYDKEGNKRFEEKQHDPGNSEGYEYDDLYRLIHYKVGALDLAGTVLVPLTQTQYDLDKLGNWNDKIKDGVTENRQHNAVNEITQIDAVPLNYDDNGNLIQDERYNYEFDQENRLTKVSFIDAGGPQIAGEYRYDALSRRIVKKTGLSRGNKETHYFYDNARIIEEQSAAGATEANYVYGNYIDEVLTMDRGLHTYYYHQNALWSVEAITDGAANVIEKYAYDAYGHPKITDGLGNVLINSWGTAHSAISNPWMFTGRQDDEETGLYYYRARVYDSGKGRFLQRDPSSDIGGGGLYVFIRNNPVNGHDPNGLKSFHPDITVTNKGERSPPGAECGGSEYVVSWGIPKEHQNEEDQGWIVQRVTTKYDVKNCEETVILSKDDDFWEGWQYTYKENISIIWAGPAKIAKSNNDTFSNPDLGDCTKGTITITGEVKAIIGFVKPDDMESTGSAPAWGLPMTRKEPKQWGKEEAGAAHTMKIEWNCCPKGTVSKATEITTNPNK